MGEGLALATLGDGVPFGAGVSSGIGEATAVGSGVGAATDVAVGISVANGVGLDGVVSGVCDWQATNAPSSRIPDKKTNLLRESLRPDRRSQACWEQRYTFLCKSRIRRFDTIVPSFLYLKWNPGKSTMNGQPGRSSLITVSMVRNFSM